MLFSFRSSRSRLRSAGSRTRATLAVCTELLLALFLCGCVLPAQEISDHSVDSKTIPWRFAYLEPGSCALGEAYLNVTTGHLRWCSSPNTWTDLLGGGAGISACSTTPPTAGTAGQVCLDSTSTLQACHQSGACSVSGDWHAAGSSSLTNYSTIAALTGYPASFTPTAHAASHASGGTDAVTLIESQVTNLPSDLAAKQATLTNYSSVSALTGYPASFTPTAHAASHASGGSDPVTLLESQITNLTADLAARALTVATGTTATSGAGSISNLGSITSATCQTLTITSASVLSTDVLSASAVGNIGALTGFVPATTGGLTISPWAGSGNVNFEVCNWTASAITSGNVRLNWRVAR